MEKMGSSKAYGFFDWVFRLVVVNLLTLLLSFFIVTILPAIVACIQTLKDYSLGETDQVYKVYFRNFKIHSEKTFLIWMLTIIILILSFVSINFYVGVDTTSIFTSLGFYMMLFMIVLVLFVLMHLSFILVYFKSLTIKETIKASILLGGKYLVTTILLFIIFILTMLLLPVLPISVLIGISLPAYFAYKLSSPIYQHLEKIHFEQKYQESRED